MRKDFLKDYFRKHTRMKLVFLVILSFSVSVELYGLGQEGEHKRLKEGTNRVFSFKDRQQHNTQSTRSNIVKNNAFKIENIGTSDNYRPRKNGNGNKSLLNVNDLKLMHKQLIQENKRHDPANTKEQQLLQHIEKQIQLRKMQQQKNRGQYKQISSSKSKMTPRTIHKVIHPQRMTGVESSNIGHAQSSLNNVFLPNITLAKMNTGINQQFPYQSQGIDKYLKMPTVNDDILKVRRLHQTFIGAETANDVVYPKQMMQQISPIPNRNEVFKDSTSRHILVPLSALNVGQALNYGMILSKSNAVPTNRVIHLVPNQFSFKEASKVQSTSPSIFSSSTTKATTPSTTSTVKPMTSSLTTPASTSDQISTTPFDFEIMKQKYLEGAMKKQDLEIKLLKLEIRALQREEKGNISQVENDNVQHPRRGESGKRKHMFPYNR